MQIVIDIPDKEYEEIIDNKLNKSWDMTHYERVIAKGKPLPKGHGSLKDEDEIVKAIEDRVEFLRKNDAVFMRLRKDIDILGCIPKIRCNVPTILEADKAESEE